MTVPHSYRLVSAYGEMPPLLQGCFWKCPVSEDRGILASQEEANLAVGLARFATAGVSTQDRAF